MNLAVSLLRRTRLSAMLFAMLTSSALYAQETATTPAPPAAMVAAPVVAQNVDVHGTYDPRRDDTASKIVVTHDEIVKYGDSNVFDVLKRVPGVTVSGSGGRGSEIRMRGLGDGYVQLLLDGDRVPAGFSLDSLAPESIERIEVLRAASAEYSTQSIAGTINVVLKKVVRTSQRQLKASFGHGPSDNNHGATLQMSDSSGALSYSLTAFVFQSDFRNVSEHNQLIFNADGDSVGLRLSTPDEVGHLTTFNFTPRLTWTSTNGDMITSQAFVSDFRIASRMTEAIQTVTGAMPTYPDLVHSNGRDSRVYREQLGWTHKFDSGATLDTKLTGFYTGSGATDWRYGDDNPAVSALHDVMATNSAERGASTQGKYTRAAWDGHALAMGWDGDSTTRGEVRRERDYLDPSGSVLDGDYDNASSLIRLAAYAQDEWNVTPRWSMYLGARWEGIRIRTQGTRLEPVYTRSSVFSPIVQTLYKFPGTKGDQLRFAVTRTYKAPDLQSLTPVRTLSLNNSQTEPDSIGNPKLKPELALGLDISYEHDWVDGALLSMSGSTRRISDVTRNLVVLDGARWTSLPLNADAARTYGLELETKLPLKAILRTATALDLRASMARNWSRVAGVPGPDNRLDAQTPLSATLGSDYKTALLSFGSTFAFKNGGLARIDGNQSIYQSVHRDLDVYALWTFDPKLHLRVSGANLLAQDYASASTYFTPGASVQTLSTVIHGYRSVRAVLEMKI